MTQFRMRMDLLANLLSTRDLKRIMCQSQSEQTPDMAVTILFLRKAI